MEDEDTDLLALREMALNSLAQKKKAIIQQPPNQYEPHSHEMFHSQNHLSNLRCMGSRQTYANQFQDHYPPPVRQPMFNPMFHQQSLPRPSFESRRPLFQGRPPLMPSVQPHLNPHFMPQNNSHPMIVPGPEIPVPHLQLAMSPAMPVLPENGVFIPTPPSRLSPRSAQ